MYKPMEMSINEYDVFDRLNKENAYYTFNDKVVPRTTAILSSMLHEQSLMAWSNHLGLYQRKEYQQFMDLVADIGTYTHKSIEIYLSYFNQKGIIDPDSVLDNMDIPFTMYNYVESGLYGFVAWLNKVCIDHKSVKVISTEMPIVCQYFGGTVDLLMDIDGEIYLIDFKTSNHVSYEHFLQLSAYRYMLITQYDIVPSKCMILQLNKKMPKYTQYVLDVSHYGPDYTFINTCQEQIISLSKDFVRRQYIENDFMNHISKESGK